MLLAVIFMVGVVVIHQQMQYIQTKNLGYDRNNVLYFSLGSNEVDPAVFLSEIDQVPGVLKASNISSSFLTGNDRAGGYSWRGQESDKKFPFKAPRIGYGVIETLGMELLAGRPFTSEYKDDISKIILNETALQMMKIEDPIGKFIAYGTEERQIIGVVKDFHYGSIHHKIEPLIFRYRSGGRNIMVKVRTGSEKTTIKKIEQLYRKFHPRDAFEFTFLDEEYQSLYVAESKVAVLSKFFSILALIISSLGLFGLTAFSTARRYKEIGIRKVFGSNLWNVIKLLTFDFMKMVVIGCLIAFPISYFMVWHWLNNFHYSVDIQWWFFAGAAGTTLLIACLTVSFHTLKAARINPVRCLRHE